MFEVREAEGLSPHLECSQLPFGKILHENRGKFPKSAYRMQLNGRDSRWLLRIHALGTARQTPPLPLTVKLP